VEPGPRDESDAAVRTIRANKNPVDEQSVVGRGRRRLGPTQFVGAVVCLSFFSFCLLLTNFKSAKINQKFVEK